MSNPSTTPAAPRPSVIQLAIKEKPALHMAYIPLFTDGGIFVPTHKDYKLADDVYVLLTLPGGRPGGLGDPGPGCGQPHPGRGHTVSQGRQVAPAQAQDRDPARLGAGVRSPDTDHLIQTIRSPSPSPLPRADPRWQVGTVVSSPHVH